MKKKPGIKTFFVCLLVFCLSGLQPALAQDDINISTTNKYAWSENTGWQNFRPAHGGVIVGTTYLDGYVWAENIGWIKLGAGSPADGQYATLASDNWGVNRDGSGNLSGYAWSETVGWINFPTDSQVTINTGSGDFDGYAWSENVGWIHFQNASPEYKVQQDGPLLVAMASFTATEDNAQNCILLQWQTASEIDNAGFHIRRSETKEEGYTRITDQLILSKGGDTWGASYSFDDCDVEPDQTYYYKLEDISDDGISSFYGPTSDDGEQENNSGQSNTLSNTVVIEDDAAGKKDEKDSQLGPCFLESVK